MWYRKEAIVEGLYAAKMLSQMMRNWEAWGLTCVCYFQPVNEQAITVSPFESHITSLGEAACRPHFPTCPKTHSPPMRRTVRAT